MRWRPRQCGSSLRSRMSSMRPRACSARWISRPPCRDTCSTERVPYVTQRLAQLGVPLFTLRFDMRAPSWGAPPAALYAAVPEMCSWAEEHGGLAAVLCEHHGSEDGYLPSPMILAPAIAARTQRLGLSLILILPFYEPVRLAEDMAVLDILSNGRASYILALGYRPEEFEHFGLAVSDRGRLADEKLALLRRLRAGEMVVHDGRRIAVTPRPLTAGGPGLMWGGGTVAAARRAGRYGLGMLGNA